MWGLTVEVEDALCTNRKVLSSEKNSFSIVLLGPSMGVTPRSLRVLFLGGLSLSAKVQFSLTWVGLHRDMTYFYPSPTSLKYIDVSSLSVRYTALVALMGAYLTIGRFRKVLLSSRRIARLIKAYVQIMTHNDLVTRKLDMLADPSWRARVLRDLGGLRKLGLWDKAFRRAQGDVPKRRVKPMALEPTWWRTPERLIESERLKAHARDCAKACVSPYTYRDPYKLDNDGLFRLAPLPRGLHVSERKATIYSQSTIGDYNFNAIPIYQPAGLGPATVWPIEFYAALKLDLHPDSGIFAPQNTRGPGYQTHIAPMAGDPVLRISRIREQDVEDHSALLSFIGEKNYNYIFEDPV